MERKWRQMLIEGERQGEWKRDRETEVKCMDQSWMKNKADRMENGTTNENERGEGEGNRIRRRDGEEGVRGKWE